MASDQVPYVAGAPTVAALPIFLADAVPGAVLADMFGRRHDWMVIAVAGMSTSLLGYWLTPKPSEGHAPIYYTTPLMGFGAGYLVTRMVPLSWHAAFIGGLVGAAAAYGLFPPKDSDGASVVQAFSTRGQDVSEPLYYRIKKDLLGFGGSPAAQFDYPYDPSEKAFNREYHG